MLTRTRHRIDPIRLRANRGTPPDRRWSGLASHASRILVGALITTGLIGGSAPIHPVQAAAQPPIGYERWTGPDAASGVDFGQSTEQVFQKYAASFAVGGVPQTHPPKDKRLIDIEVRADGSGLAHYVYDVVWVKDEGDFQLESWFLPGLTEAELKSLPQLAPQGVVALDLERYPDGNQWRYSVILQQNDGKFDWEVLTDASLQLVLDTVEREEMRVLDLDFADPGPLVCPTGTGQACSPATFDAILVANSGSKAITWNVWFNLTPAQLAAQEAKGWQVIDREVGGETVTTVVVKAGWPYEILDDLSEYEVNFEHGHHGRVVDLEGAPNAFSIVRFDGSAAPSSPGLADAQQGDNDDGPRAKPRNEKAKGKNDRDRKAKNKKGGKHGKGRGR